MRGSRGLKLLSVGAMVTLLGMVAVVGGGAQVRAAPGDDINSCGGWTVWTTDKDGNGVNGNQFSSKADVYLNGGPNKNSRLVPAGTYRYDVTDGGSSLYRKQPPPLIVPNGGDGNGEFSRIPLWTQLYPFDDTTSPGGEYKVTVTRDGCSSESGKSDGFKVKATSTPTNTPTATATVPAVTPTSTATAVVASTATATPTATVGSSPTATATATATGTSTTATATVTATRTPTTAAATATAVPPSGPREDPYPDDRPPAPSATPVVAAQVNLPPATPAVHAGGQPPAVAGIAPPTPPVETPEPTVEAAAPPVMNLVVEPRPAPDQPSSLPSAGESDSGPAGWLLAGGLFLMMSGLLLRTRESQSVHSH